MKEKPVKKKLLPVIMFRPTQAEQEIIDTILLLRPVLRDRKSGALREALWVWKSQMGQTSGERAAPAPAAVPENGGAK